MKDLYRDRLLSLGYPDLERLGVEWYREHQHDRDEPSARTLATLDCLPKLIDVSLGSIPVTVIGCGPRPLTMRELKRRGYAPVGIEPVEGSADAAREFLDSPDAVLAGEAEAIPLPDESQRVVLMESVLEHVDSVSRCLAECYRVLQPGGVLFVQTTNRSRFSLRGYTGEYRLPFFNLYPRTVRESYVFHHLHYDPRLANYTPRPAVHWFSYADLCALGREAGFGQFYSKLDLSDANSPLIQQRWVSRMLYRVVRFRPWLRAIALLQFGSAVYMLKRPRP
jgi:ubiquinone/menaquinone biosynthesis C-methylase UbiE